MSKDYKERLAQWPEAKRQQLAEKLAVSASEEQLTAHVLGEGIDEENVRAHLAERVPPFMIPSQLVVVNAFPKTANGKIDRKALATYSAAPKVASKNSVREASNRFEIGMAALWAEVLGLDTIAVDENFFELGGNSIIMIKLIGKIRETYGIKLPMTAIGSAPTTRKLVQQIEEDDQEVSWPILVPINEDGEKPPFFMIHGLGGGIFDYYRLKAHLPEGHPFYAIQAPLTPCADLITMATTYVEAIREVQPKGPYNLGGYCLGAVVAFEMAQQFKEDGEEVALLALVDSSPPRRPLGGNPAVLGSMLKQRVQHFISSDAKERRSFLRNKSTNIAKRARRLLNLGGSTEQGFAAEAEDHLDLNGYPQAYREIVRVHFRALRDYKPKGYAGPAFVFGADDDHWTRQDPTLGWGDWITGDLTKIDISGDHHTTLQEPHIGDLGRKLAQTLLSSNPSV